MGLTRRHLPPEQHNSRTPQWTAVCPQVSCVHPALSLFCVRVLAAILQGLQIENAAYNTPLRVHASAIWAH